MLCIILKENPKDTAVCDWMLKNKIEAHLTKSTLVVHIATFRLLEDKNVWKVFEDLSLSNKGKNALSDSVFNSTGIKSVGKNNPDLIINFMNRAVATVASGKKNFIQLLTEQVNSFGLFEKETLKVREYLVKYEISVNLFSTDDIISSLLYDMMNVILLL